MTELQAEEEVERIMKEVDKNNSGSIDYSGLLFNKKYNRICFSDDQQRIFNGKRTFRNGIQNV